MWFICAHPIIAAIIAVVIISLIISILDSESPSGCYGSSITGAINTLEEHGIDLDNYDAETQETLIEAMIEQENQFK